MSPVYKLSNAGGFTSKQRYTSMLAGNPVFQPTSFESIATVTVGSGGAATISFTSIPSTFEHLEVRFFTRSAGAFTQARIKINNDSNTNYTLHQLTGNGSTVSSVGYANEGAPVTIPVRMPDTASIFGAAVMSILDYKNTNKFKTIRTLGGADLNGSGQIILSSNLYRSTSAITQLEFSGDGANFAQYSHIALYGIKSA